MRPVTVHKWKTLINILSLESNTFLFGYSAGIIMPIVLCFFCFDYLSYNCAKFLNESMKPDFNFNPYNINHMDHKRLPGARANSGYNTTKNDLLWEQTGEKKESLIVLK